MAFLTSEPISALAVALLRRSIVLPATVSRVPAPDFAGPSGGTVKVRVPRTRTARQQVTPGADITYDSFTEDEVDVALSHWYNGSLISDEDLTLTLEDFGQQVLLPQAAAIAEQAETTLADVMISSVPPITGGSGIEWASPDPDPVADYATLLAAREQLTINKVPQEGRYLACAPDIITRLLGIPTFVQAANRGDGGTALSSAVVGTVFGLQVVESPSIDAGTAVAYHRSAFAFANVAPTAPTAGADSTVASDSGLQLRSLLGFDPGKLSSVCIVSVFAGASVIEDQGVVKRAIKIITA